MTLLLDCGIIKTVTKEITMDIFNKKKIEKLTTELANRTKSLEIATSRLDSREEVLSNYGIYLDLTFGWSNFYTIRHPSKVLKHIGSEDMIAALVERSNKLDKDKAFEKEVKKISKILGLGEKK